LAARLSIEQIWLDEPPRSDRAQRQGAATASSEVRPADRPRVPRARQPGLQYYKLRHIFLYRNAIVEKARRRRLVRPDEERARRLEARGYFSRSSAWDEDLRRWEHAMRANEAMVARVLLRLGVPCVPVDGRASIDEVHSDVLAAMSEAGAGAKRTSQRGDDHPPSASTSKP
jgi:hypothetical protein